MNDILLGAMRSSACCSDSHLFFCGVNFWGFLGLFGNTEAYSWADEMCTVMDSLLGSVVPAIEGLVVVDEIRIETGAVKEPEEHTPPP